MSREVLLNVVSSPMELADVTATQIRPITSDGTAASQRRRRAAARSAMGGASSGIADSGSAAVMVSDLMVVAQRGRQRSRRIVKARRELPARVSRT